MIDAQIFSGPSVWRERLQRLTKRFAEVEKIPLRPDSEARRDPPVAMK
jgi:hypothetical protein